MMRTLNPPPLAAIVAAFNRLFDIVYTPRVGISPYSPSSISSIVQ